MRPAPPLTLAIVLAALCIACESSDSSGEGEATLSVDPRFVASLETGPLAFDVSGDAPVGGDTQGVVTIYVSRSNAEGCVQIDGSDEQGEAPFVGFDATADIYRYPVDAQSFEFEVTGVCLGTCTADAAAEFALLLNEGSLEPDEPLTAAKFFNIDCAPL
jgi:hypothetical protein